eukprot:361603-Chlamydomonas_euryale.AAC.15
MLSAAGSVAKNSMRSASTLLKAALNSYATAPFAASPYELVKRARTSSRNPNGMRRPNDSSDTTRKVIPSDTSTWNMWRSCV